MNIENYLTEEQKQEIAIEEWRLMCREACNGNAERIISNIGHHVAEAIVFEALGDDAFEQIRAKAVDVINNLSEFTVFRRADRWDNGETPAFKTLSDAVVANKDLVDKKVRECIAQLSKREALEVIKSGKIHITPKD